jgi:hypothetical protein
MILLGTFSGIDDDPVRSEKLFGLNKGVTKRRHLPLLRKAPSYMSRGGGEVAGPQPVSTALH